MECTIYCCNKNEKTYNLVYSDNMNDIVKTKESKDDWSCSLCQNTTSKYEKMYQISIPDKFRRVCKSCLNHDYFNIVFKEYAKFIKERIESTQEQQVQVKQQEQQVQVKQQEQQVKQQEQQVQQEQEPVDNDYKLFVAIDNGDIYSILKIISESNEKVQPKHLNNDLLKPLRRQYMLIILEYYSKNDYKSKPITLNSGLGQFLLYYLFEIHPRYNPQPILMHKILMQLMGLPKETNFDNVITKIDEMVFPDDNEMENNMPSMKYYNRIRENLL